MTTPEFVVDLTLPPERRFEEIGETYGAVLRRLLSNVRRELLAEVGPWTRPIFDAATTSASRFLTSVLADHPHVRELAGLARASSIELEDLYLANVVYDLTAGFRIPGWVGCTGFVHGGPSHPMIARAMDWNMPSGIGEHSIVLRYRARDHEFVSVGFPGITGVVSGLSSHGFGITVNQRFRDSAGVPNWATPLLWLVREAFENATSYASARRFIASRKAASPGFLLMCGTEVGEACLIETDGEADVVHRVGEGEVQSVANHPPNDELGDDYEAGGSEDRFVAMDSRARKLATADRAKAQRTLATWPIAHANTVHQMVIEPRIGSLTLRCPHRGETRHALIRVRRPD